MNKKLLKWLNENIISGIEVSYEPYDTDKANTFVRLKSISGQKKKVKWETIKDYLVFEIFTNHCFKLSIRARDEYENLFDKEKIREKALSKLTKEEKEVLGLI